MSATKPLRDLLTAKLVARLAMRWQESQAYVPTGSNTVLCRGELPEDERAAFDSYVLGYQDAIEDAVRHTSGAMAEPQPYAMSLAESSIFQGGTPPAVPRQGNRDQWHTGGGRPTRQNSEARQRLEDLFSGGESS